MDAAEKGSGRQTVIHMMNARPGALAEWMANTRDKDEPEYDENDPIEYLRKFCNWQDYLQQLVNINIEDDIKQNIKDNNNTKTKLNIKDMKDMSPLMALKLLVIVENLEKDKEKLDIKTQKDKLAILMKDGAWKLKNTLRQDKVYYYNPYDIGTLKEYQQSITDA
eukprot:407946_1